MEPADAIITPVCKGGQDIQPGQKAIIVDIDDCVTEKVLARYDYDDFYQTSTTMTRLQPNCAVIQLVQLLREIGHGIIFVTARPRLYDAPTRIWLHRHVGQFSWLYMCPNNWTDWKQKDMSSTAAYKLLTATQLINEYNIRWAFDDDARCITQYQNLGIPCIHVNPPLGNILLMKKSSFIGTETK